VTALAAWRLRAQLKSEIRSFFARRGYLELDTPILVPCPGTEVYLGYFKSAWRDHAGTERTLWLRSSPELHLKQALAAGAQRVFQLAPCFRNDGELADWHHPEFTMLEWYEAGIGFDEFIGLTEELLRETHAALAPHVRRELGQEPVRLPPRFQRVTVTEAFRDLVGLELVDGDPDLALKALAIDVMSVSESDDFETAFFKVLMEKVEPALVAMGGAVLLDYPPSQAALATVAGGVAKRFEFYLSRVELCNGFLELLDPEANRARIREACRRRAAAGRDVPDEDEAFYAALERGLPPSCGNALGFDRWLGLLLGDQTLDRAIPFRPSFPTARTRDR
jgi:lysyl-tRNA synthetase class 2